MTSSKSENARPGQADSLHLLPLGAVRGARQFVVQNGGDEIVTIPIVAFLITSGERRILVDSGMSAQALEDAAAAWGTVADYFTPVASDEDRLDRRLAQLGLGTDDITDVVLTHLHFDHAGGVGQLGRATLWVQRGEYRAALHPERFEAGGYLPGEFDVRPEAFRFVSGDHVIAPGVHVLATPGHTGGHQSVLVDVAGAGWHCLVGDVADSREIVDRRLLPGVVADAAAATLSIQRLRWLEAALGARLLFSHDAEQHASLPAFPTPLAGGRG